MKRGRIFFPTLGLCAAMVGSVWGQVDETVTEWTPVAPVRAYAPEVDLTAPQLDPTVWEGEVGIAAPQTVEADVRSNGTATQYAAFTLDDDGADNLFIKVQQQGATGEFTHFGFYHGNNGGGWAGMTGGSAFDTLAAPFTTAHMMVTYNGAGSVTLRFTEIDGGTGTQTYIRGGWANRNGAGLGIGGFEGSSSIDNWGNAVGEVCDNFDRPNGGLGSKWVIVAGSASIVSNTARVSSSGRARYIGACAGDTQTVEADMRINGTGLQYGALLLDGDANNNLFVKVQAQTATGRFSHVGFYDGNNGGGWGGMTGGSAFFVLDSEFTSAHMSVYHNGFGDVTLVFSKINGGSGLQIYQRGGWAPLDGDRVGMGGYTGLTIIDNWGAGGGLICDDFNRANGPLGPNWQTVDSVASIVSNAARGGSSGDPASRSWFIGNCGACSDVTAPLVSMTAPPAESCACSIVQVTGSVSDPDGTYDGDVLEYRRSDLPNWTQAGSSSTERSGVLYNWNTAGLSEGLYFLRVTATNTCGLSNSAVTIVYVDRSFNPVDLRAPQAGNILANTVCFDGTVWDRCFDNYRVEWQPAGGGAFNPVDPGNPIYTATVINDPLAAWNVTGVADGDYRIRVTGVDSCGNSDVETRVITVDNTAPVAQIASPTECICVEGTVQIVGTANDANLQSWALQYTGGDAHGWVTIASGNTPVINALLANWNTAGLKPCAYTLRLSVADKSSISCSGNVHISEHYTSVDVGNCGGPPCTGEESLKPKCKSGKVTAQVVKGVPGQTVNFLLDGGQPKSATVNNKGKAKTSWNGVPVGQHEVQADLPCALSLKKNVTCS